MLNKVVLIGRLTRDPELRYTPGNGVAVCNFGLAVERPFTNRQGEREVDFINIVTWRNVAETCANHLGKGRLVAVDGRIQVRSYEDNEGQKKTFVEVVGENVKFLDWPKDQSRSSSSENREPSRDSNRDSTSRDGFGIGGEEYHVDEDDVPF